jgi:hypothetical protein
MKINPYLKTTLSEPFQGKYLHEAGAEVVMNMHIKSKTLGDFMVMLPDPVSLNLNNAQNFIDKCEKLKERINKARDFTVFSNILTEEKITGKSKEEIHLMDPSAVFFRKLDNDKVFEYIQTSMGVVVSLITAVESFVNLIIPHNHSIERVNSKGITETLDKTDMIRKLSIVEKLELVATVKGKNDLKQQKFWTTFKTIKDLRDNIIHFKKMDNKINEMWTPIVVSFLDSDLQDFFNQTVSMISFLHPDYLNIKG